MTETIIGGAIAAVLGAVGYAIIGLWQEHRREKARRLAIVDALIVEAEENLKICQDPMTEKLWWLALFKLEAYQAHRGNLFFLSEKVRSSLAEAAFLAESINYVIQWKRSLTASKETIQLEPGPSPEALIKILDISSQELRRWRAEHSRSLPSRICRRLRKLPQ